MEKYLTIKKIQIIKDYFPLMIKETISQFSVKDLNQESFTLLQVRIQMPANQTEIASFKLLKIG